MTMRVSSGKGLDGVSRNEPRGAKFVSFEQSQEPRHPHFTSEHSARDVVGGVLASVLPKPAGDNINVDAECDAYFLCHCRSPFNSDR